MGGVGGSAQGNRRRFRLGVKDGCEGRLREGPRVVYPRRAQQASPPVPARRTFEVPAEICKAKAQALLVRRRRQLPADFISEGKTGALKQTGMPLRSSFHDERMGKDGTGPQSCCLRTTEL
eukprot:scaffold371_cov273-Pinguiococcus_pyrenoidosus.AAC.4